MSCSRFYYDEFGNKFDLNKIEDVTAIIRDAFSMAEKKRQCECIKINIELIAEKRYRDRVMEISEKEGNK